MQKYFGNYINGIWVQYPGRKTFDSINPTTLEVLGTFEFGTKEDVSEAVKVAKETFRTWSKVPAPRRGEILLRAAQLMRERKEELARLISQENGKILAEARGEVQEAIDFFEYIAGEGRRLFGETYPSELPNKFCMSIRQPMGVVGLITPFNYPIAIPAWKIGAALICGNTIIFKPSSLVPLGAVALIEILEEAGLPKGVIQVIFGRGSEIGDAITKHPEIRAISFTGGEETGRLVYVQSANDLKRVHLELGGHAPLIVMEDADIDLAIEAVLFGAFGTAGQRCTTTRRLLVHFSIYEEVRQKLVVKLSELKIGNPLDELTDIGPLIDQVNLKNVLDQLEIAIDEGAKIAFGGKPIKQTGFFMQPTLLEVESWMTIAKKEVFGPILSMIKFESFEEAIEIANGTKYGLS